MTQTKVVLTKTVIEGVTQTLFEGDYTIIEELQKTSFNHGVSSFALHLSKFINDKALKFLLSSEVK